MIIGGLQKLTLIDYPGKIACAVFTIGCNFRCSFCHNPELVDAAKFDWKSAISEEKFFDFLKSRQGLLDGVCVTGGEPLLHNDLPEFLKKIKDLRFRIKVDTNGASPGKLLALIKDGLVDYVAMDVKTNVKCQMSNVKTSYEKVCGAKVKLEDIKRSVDIIMTSGLDYEFRTTVAPTLHTEEDIIEIAKEIRGAKRYYLQQFRPGEKVLSQEYRSINPYPAEFLQVLRDKIKGDFEICEVRE
jgi:pyruvate formate lyase activating enzyme